MRDDARFEAFVRTHQDAVFATAVRLLGNPTEAEDIAQTVFLKAYERFADIGASPTAAGWVRTVTRNACLNHLSRYRSRWRLFSELVGRGSRAAPAEADELEEALAGHSSPATSLEAAERQQQLEQALRRLPEAQRVPLVLFHFEDASYQEIAQMLGVSLGKVKTDIHRGRKALGQYLSVDHAIR